MAKRKRLTPARLDAPASGFAEEDDFQIPAGLETKSMFPRYPDGVARHAPPRPAALPPIAQVAGEAAGVAAFAEVAQTLADARSEGRLILRLPLDAVEDDYLVRDRVLAEDEEMQALLASLRARGQQAAIEVADLGQGRWGLISGWRRLTALRRLAAEGAGPGTVLAIARRPTEAAEAYLAMVEENEIRVGLSYYERARIVLRAVEKRVYPSDKAGLQALFAAASRAKRSKIGSFLRIVRALDAHLRFPAALGERAGLALATALDRDEGLEPRLIAALAEAAPETAEAEAQVIARAIAPRRGTEEEPEPTLIDTPDAQPEEHLPGGITLVTHADGRLTLRGGDADFRDRLLDWLRTQG